MPSDACKQRSSEPKERTVYIKFKRNGTRNKEYSLCVCVGGEGWEGAEEGIHLFQTAFKNLANKYFHFGQFVIVFNTVLLLV